MGRKLPAGKPTLGILAALALGSCGASDAISRLTLTDGRLVSDLTGRSSATVVLLYSPTHCFTCAGLLAEWRQFGRDTEVDVALVLTAAPTADQEAGLAVRRVPVSGVVAEGNSTPQEPSAYYFRGGELAGSAVGEVEQALFLRELRDSVKELSSPGPSQ